MGSSPQRRRFERPYFVSPHAVKRFRERTGLLTSPDDRALIDLIQAALQGPRLPVDAVWKGGQLTLVYRMGLAERTLYLVVGSGEGEWPAVITVLDESSAVHSELRKAYRYKERFGRFPARPWPEHGDEILAGLRATGYSIRDCARIMRRGHMSLWKALHGLRREPANLWSIADTDRAVKARASGRTLRETGRIVGRTERAVEGRLRRLRKARLAEPAAQRLARIVAGLPARAHAGRIISAVRKEGIECLPEPFSTGSTRRTRRPPSARCSSTASGGAGM